MRADAHWKPIGLWPHHGICLPLSSLRTKKNCGVGEFLDALPLIEWCKRVGFDCLQLLPLNDTGNDPSPYNPLSSCALDLIYLSLWDLPDANLDIEPFLPYRDSPRLYRYEVKTLKLQWLHSYFERMFPSFSATNAYRAFLNESPWLPEYARFMANKSSAPIDFHMLLQYLCYSQLEKVRAFATERSFFLIGDIPYLLSPDSADVWAHSSLFRLDLAAGAPPDQYNALGQNWGFPLFDWEAMRKERYAWWKRRLAMLPKLYHIYRIDHVVGFFRIWAIAQGKKTSEGSFIPADPALWINQGRAILEMLLDTCPLLPIAEDLGTIPPAVYPVLKELGICGTKVLRWQDAIPYNQYEPLSLTTVSTPDMEPLPLWWQKFPLDAAALAKFKNWQYSPTLSRERQIEILRGAHSTASRFHINLLQEYLYPFPDLSWPNPEDDRINIPGTLLPTNWTYRFRPYLEEIIDHASLAQTIRSILSN